MPAAISVNVTDTFEQWRLKTNQISIDVFDAVRNVHEDLTPSLGGDLYLNNTETGYTGSFDILGTGNINIDGTITSTGNISGADITGTGDLQITGGISGANFVVSSVNGNVTGSNWSVDGTTGELTLGAGITYQLNDAWQARFEYQYFDHLGNDAIGSTNAHFTSLGISYQFGRTRNKEVTKTLVKKVTIELEEVTFLDLKTDVVERELERERQLIRSGSIAENILRDVGVVDAAKTA